MSFKKRPEQTRPREDGIFAILSDYIAEHGVPPTIREIGDACGISSTSLVKGYLVNLEKRGFIELPPKHMNRGIRLANGAANKPSASSNRATAKLLAEIQRLRGGIRLAIEHIEAERPTFGETESPPIIDQLRTLLQSESNNAQ